MITYTQANTEKELRQILALQQKNLPKNRSRKELSKEGFVTVEHTFELLQKMNKACKHTIAKENGNVIGYALSMHPKFGNAIEVLRPMFEQLGRVYNKQDFLVMGQICIAKEFRGKGIFRGLYQHMKKFTKTEFETIITEVDLKNQRSIRAHQAVGFQELSRYLSDGKEWSLIVLK